MRDHFEMFGRYNRWANEKLYAACEVLSDADYRRDCAVAFKSMHGTLNHLLVADQIWMARFDGKGPSPTKLDEILFDDFAALRQARKEADERIVAFTQNQTEESLRQDFSYTPVTTPERVTQVLAPTLAHFFNHQTHHRGQAHAILTRLTGEAPSLDLIYFQRETRLGQTH